MEQLKDFLKRYNLKDIALGMLDREIEPSEFGVLASYFANVALFIEDMRLTPAEKGDVCTLVSSHGNQMAMLRCFRAWRSHNPACATYRTLLQIVLKVGQVEIAEHVLQHMIKMDNVNSTQQTSFY